MPEDVPPLPWRAHWPALAVAVLGAAVAWWAKVVLFPHLSWNRDEPVYLWQMEVLRDGRLAAPDGGAPGVLLPWLSAARDGELFTQYPPGWPAALLLARVVTGTASAALPIAGALCAGGTYAFAYELLRRRDVAVVAGLLMVGSPIFALQGGVHLTYVFTLGLGLSASALVLSGIRRGRRGRLLLAGVLLGWIFLTRPYDALVWGGVPALYVMWSGRDRWREPLQRLLLTGAAALPFVVAALLVNRRLTGSFLEFPVAAKDPLDTFGFGTRRLAPTFRPVDYSLTAALRASAKNAFFFPWFLAGTYVALVAAGLAVVRWRRRPTTWLMLGLGAAFPLTYLPFWGTYLSSLASRISGPIYLVPLYAPICILVAALLVDWRRRRPTWAAALAVLLVAATVPAAWDRFSLNQEISRSQAPWEESLTEVQDPSIVLVADSGYVLYANPFGSNRPELDGPRIFAVPVGAEVLDLIAAHPDRSVYLQAANVAAPEIGPREDPVDLEVVVAPATVARGRALALRPELRLPPGSEVSLTVASGLEERSWRGRAGALPATIRLGGDGAGSIEIEARGSLVVTATWEEPGASPPQRLRAVLHHREVDGVVEVLTPPLWERWVVPPGADEGEWRHTLPPAELSVSVSPSA